MSGEDEWHGIRHITDETLFIEELRAKKSMLGCRTLATRVMDFYLHFLHIAKKYGSGPFQTISDNSEGVCWIDISSMVELVTHVCRKWPDFLIENTVNKMYKRAQTKTSIHSVPSTPSHRESSIPTTNETADPARFVDFDAMLNILIESYLDEDARMHHLVYDSFVSTVQPSDKPTRKHKKPTLKFDKSETDSQDGKKELEPEFFSLGHFCEVLKVTRGKRDDGGGTSILLSHSV